MVDKLKVLFLRTGNNLWANLLGRIASGIALQTN
jgi:hypothetical protein